MRINLYMEGSQIPEELKRWMQDSEQDQTEKEEVKIISSIHHNEQESHPAFQSYG